jgi:hypothetical protein
MSAENVDPNTRHRQPKQTPALTAWRARLSLETGGPDWQVQGPPAPLSPAAELALLAVKQLRRELADDMAALNIEIGRTLPDSLEAKRDAYRAAGTPTSFDLATRRLRHRRRVA